MNKPYQVLLYRISRLPHRSTTYIHRPLQTSWIRPGSFSKVLVRQASQRGPVNRRRSTQYIRFGQAGNLYNRLYTSPTFRYRLGAVVLGAGVFYYWNLERVPISGRLRFNCFPPQWEERLAEMRQQAVLGAFRGSVLPPSHPYSQMVHKVMRRLIPVSGQEHLNWEVTVIDDPAQANAFVIPGGKVFVFSGIFPICGGEDGLAAVLGHEISHQLADHDGEKMSQNILLVALGLYFWWQYDVSGQVAAFLLEYIFEKPGSRKMEVRAVDFIA